MDSYAEQWRLISEGFPISHPPEYEMIAASLNSRAHLAVIPIAVLNTGAAPLLRFALPGGSVPNNQVKPRAGPIVARSRSFVRVTQLQDGEFLLNSDFATCRHLIYCEH